MKKIICFLAIFFVFSQIIFAQDIPPQVKNPPVIFETAFNNRGIFNQSLI